MNAFDQIISSAGDSRTMTPSTLVARRVLEPQIVDPRDAVARAEDHVHEVLAVVDLPEPVRERHLGLVAELLERLEHARTVVRLDEDVDVLGVARHVRVVRERERAADQKRNAGVVQLLQRVDVEVGGRIVDRRVRSRFPSGSSGRDGVGGATPAAMAAARFDRRRRCVDAAPRRRETAADRRNVRVSSGIDTL